MASGLRERNKERTREALIDAALRVVSSDGIDALTAARVADEAEVSRRTFFNYFAKVEDVFAQPINEIVTASIETFLSHPAEVPLRQAVLASLEALLYNEAFEQLSTVVQFATGSPAARRLLLDVEECQTRALEIALRQRIGAEADEAYVVALAAAAAGIFGRICSIEGDRQLSKSARTEYLRETLLRAYNHLLVGFDESGATVKTGA